MKKLNLQNLRGNHNDILKSEIGALLFNLGKTHIGFWEEKDGVTYFNLDKTYKDQFKREYGYYFKHYKEYFEGNDIYKYPFEIDLEKVGKNIKPLLMDTEINLKFGTKPIKLKLINVINGDAKVFKDQYHFIEKIMSRGCENINSGIDKGSPKKQLRDLKIANAFGSIKGVITDRDTKEYNYDIYDKRRIDFLRKLDKSKINFDDGIVNAREYVQTELKEWYSHLLSDSRYPINDVTLWDQAYMTSSMFKAALAAMSLDGTIYDECMRKKKPRKIKWSILGVQYDKLGLAEKAMNPYFIKWYRDKSCEVDEKVKQLIEVNYALGNEIYRDETGIYFIVPENICSKNKVNKNDTEKLYYLDDSLIELQDEIIKCFEDFNGEVFPAIFLTEPSRGTMNIAYLLENAKKNFLSPIYPNTVDNKSSLEIKEKEELKPICDVCRTRLAEKKVGDLNLCSTCDKRFSVRRKKELRNDNDKKETAFTGELQDSNGRIALVTLKFELSEWLNGDMLNLMLRNKNIDKSLDRLKNNIIDNLGCKEKGSVIKDLVYDKDLYGGDTVKNYCERILIERTIGDEWETFLQKNLGDKVSFTNRTIKWDELTDSDRTLLSEVLIQFIIRKNPSPARFRRIWESTEDFFKELQDDLSAIFNMPAWRNKRFKFSNIVDEQHKNMEFEYKGLNFITKDRDLYLITSLKQSVPILKKDTIKNKDAYSEVEEGKSDWIRESEIELTNMEDNSKYLVALRNAEYISYKPYISIIKPTPISWQFIMPAEYVMNVIEEVRKRYDKDFTYVKGKLPLHIGIVFQDYKSPLYIGIKALRNIRRDIYDWDSIKEERTGKFLMDSIGIDQEDDRNPNRKFYSLFQLPKVNYKDENIYRFHLPKEGEKNISLKDVDEACKDEKYYVYPNTIDFEFLDTNIRRNDITYNYEEDKPNAKRVIELKSNRPYTWEEWDNFAKFKNYFSGNNRSTKLQSMVSLIYSKLNEWDGEENQAVLSHFMISAFINVFELKNEKDRNEFAQVLGIEDWNVLKELSDNELSGNEFKRLLYMFLDMYDFWHNCLKKICEGGAE